MQDSYQQDADNSTREILNQFQQSEKLGTWLHIDKDQLLFDLFETVNAPSTINGMSARLSGFAAIAFELARRQAATYVKICVDLFEFGAFFLHGELFEPIPDLRKFHLPAAMRAADWLFLATLENLENGEDHPFTAHESEQSPVSETSQTSLITGWLSRFFPRAEINYLPTRRYGAFEGLYRSKQVIQQGGTVFMLVTARFFGAEQIKTYDTAQWIVFLNVQSSSGELPSPNDQSFFCTFFSSGQQVSLQMSRYQFEQNIVGILFAEL